jgi:hypothetical protein
VETSKQREHRSGGDVKAVTVSKWRGIEAMKASKRWGYRSGGGIEVVDINAMKASEWWRHRSGGGIEAMKASEWWRHRSGGGIEAMKASK